MDRGAVETAHRALQNCGQVFRSTDSGESWTRLKHEFGELRALHWRPLAVKQGEHSLVFKKLI